MEKNGGLTLYGGERWCHQCVPQTTNKRTTMEDTVNPQPMEFGRLKWGIPGRVNKDWGMATKVKVWVDHSIFSIIWKSQKRDCLSNSKNPWLLNGLRVRYYVYVLVCYGIGVWCAYLSCFKTCNITFFQGWQMGICNREKALKSFYVKKETNKRGPRMLKCS